MSQKPLDFGPSERDATTRAKLFEVYTRIVDRVGLKEVAFNLNIAPSYLADAKAGRNGKSWRSEWEPTLYRLASDHEADEWMSILKEHRAPERSDAENLARVLRLLKEKLGSVGDEIAKEALR